MLILELDGQIVPKLRPKVDTKTKHAYNPQKYTDWKEQAKRDLAGQWFGNPLLTEAHISIIIWGTHNCDPDNIEGAILDALVQGKIIKDDKLKNIPHLSVTYRPQEADKGATIYITSEQLGDYIDDFRDIKRFRNH